ncbi:MAG: hypothetical protein K2X66_00345 [Cyanobacteria bacterium]|jgi:hypothetical protein|nr:hypothetical protein [Cyanobacteriota bacterium]
MDINLSEDLRVIPAIGRLNKYLQRAKKVAISSINPVYFGDEDDGNRRLHAFNIRVEGPAKHVSYFHRLIDEANLKIS